jgi:Domain of unknown function (DUF6916)
MLEHLTRDSFAPLLNAQFRMVQGANVFSMDLIEVSELRSSRHNEAFTLVFRGPSDRFLSQSTYQFDHPSLGVFELFIVPIGQDKHGLYYEALFNRLRLDEQE